MGSVLPGNFQVPTVNVVRPIPTDSLYFMRDFPYSLYGAINHIVQTVLFTIFGHTLCTVVLTILTIHSILAKRCYSPFVPLARTGLCTVPPLYGKMHWFSKRRYAPMVISEFFPVQARYWVGVCVCVCACVCVCV